MGMWILHNRQLALHNGMWILHNGHVTLHNGQVYFVQWACEFCTVDMWILNNGYVR